MLAGAKCSVAHPTKILGGRWVGVGHGPPGPRYSAPYGTQNSNRQSEIITAQLQKCLCFESGRVGLLHTVLGRAGSRNLDPRSTSPV